MRTEMENQIEHGLRKLEVTQLDWSSQARQIRAVASEV
jgi:hypothetical protein